MSLFAIPLLASALTVSSNTVCTMDAKLCSDGSYVSRSGPNCEFAACPSDLPGDTAPVVAEPCLTLKYDLYLGSVDIRTNSEVSALQNFLSPKYLNSDPTGYFGKLTLKAVQTFQAANGVRATGYVGPVTRAKLKALTCGGKIIDPGTTTPPTIPPVTLPPTYNVTVSSVSPNQITVGSTVTLYGTGLNVGHDYVLFAGYRLEIIPSKVANQVSFLVPQYLSTTINCIKAPCPLGPTKEVVAGTYTVQVVNDNGQSNEMKLVVTDGTVVTPADTVSITDISPTSGKIGDTIVISGTNFFRSETKLLFDGASISGTPIYLRSIGNSNSAFQFTVPKTVSYCSNVLCTMTIEKTITPGIYEIAVENKLGRVGIKFEVLGDTTPVPSLPTISTMTPASAPVTTTVTIFGTNLATAQKVLFDGYSINFTTVGNSLQFAVPEYLSACPTKLIACTALVRQVTPGKYAVSVVNAAGTSNTFTFEVIDGAPSVATAPVIQVLTPTSAKVGDTVQITGTNLNLGSEKIYFGGTLVGQNSSANTKSSLSFVVPAYYQACPPGTDCKIASVSVVPGTYQITVINQNGQSNSVPLTVVGTTVPPVTTPGITVTSPNGGNVFTVGDIVPITWASNGTTIGDKVTIALRYSHRDTTYVSGTSFEEYIMLDAPNTGSYSWKIPEYFSTGVQTNTFSIRVFSSTGFTDSSDATFTINPAMSPVTDIAVASPVLGKSYMSSEMVPITWTPLSSDQYAVALLRASDKNFLRLVFPSYNSQSNLSWSVPANIPAGNDYYLRITQGNYRAKTGYSSVFSINMGSVSSLAITSMEIISEMSGSSLSRNLKWTTTGATTCTASGAWSGAQATSGTYSVGFLSQPLTYTLTCTNSQGQSATKSITSS